MNGEDEAAHKSGSYGKRPLWQWIIIYLIVAVILYGVVYYLFIARQGSY